MSRRYIASAISTCVGENPYEAICDKLEQMWRRENSESYFMYHNVYKPNGSLLKKQRKLQKSLTSDEAKKATEIKNDTSLTTKEKVNKIQSIPNTTLSSDAHELVINQLKSEVSTSHGVHNEQSAIQKYANETNQIVEPLHRLCKKEYANIIISGKVDGIVKQSDEVFKIVEVKNRTRRLFHKVVSYEYCQVQCYMYILDQKECDIVEKFNNDINIFPVERNQTYIEFVFDALSKFDRLLTLIQNDSDLQRDYATSDNQDDFIKSFIGLH
jgi:uncharacterized protein YajQ (UPF0234 family)